MRIVISLLLVILFTYAHAQTSNDTIHWHADKPLLWEDFKGEAINGIGLSGEAFCMTLATWKRPSAFHKIQFKVTPVFDRDKSWANHEMKVPQGLTYFQVMFNLYEVHARKLRQDLSNTKFSADPTGAFQEKYNLSMNGLTSEFNQFRKETKLGSDADALSQWKLKVDEELKALEAFQQ